MAIIFIGSTKCALCGELLLEEDSIKALPPSTKKDNYLHKYFDCAFHLNCFESWGKKDEILQIVTVEMQEFMNSDYYKEMIGKYGEPHSADT